jgi:hypothetical protein
MRSLARLVTCLLVAHAVLQGCMLSRAAWRSGICMPDEVLAGMWVCVACAIVVAHAAQTLTGDGVPLLCAGHERLQLDA